MAKTTLQSFALITTLLMLAACGSPSPRPPGAAPERTLPPTVTVEVGGTVITGPAPTEKNEMQELERVRVIAAHYRSLQGLRSLPWFLWVLTLGAVNPILGLPQGQLDYQCLLIVPGIVVPWALSRLIGNYYDRTLGQVERLPLQSRLTEWLIGAGFVIAATIGWVVDSMQRLPVSVSGLIMAGALFAQWWRTSRLFPQKALLAALLAGLSLLPLTGVLADGHWYDLFGGFVVPITLGIVLSVGSVLDHVALVRNLRDLSKVEP